eukprot:gene3867-4819_t
MFDGSEETCWNSHQGTPQFIMIQFPQANGVDLKELQIMFQGGFVGKECEISVCKINANTFTNNSNFYPKDVNTLQSFPIEGGLTNVKELKILFPESTDFFGRITIYKLDVLGNPSS